MLICDFNVKESEPVLAQILHNSFFHAVNIIHQNACYKSINNRNCSDLIISNSPNFQSASTFCTGLFDFHKLVVTVLKTSFRKTAPKEIHRDYNKFNVDDFKTKLKQYLATSSSNYKHFEQAFLALLGKHSPYKSEKIRENQVPYMTKNLRKAIMKRSQLKIKYFKTNTAESLRLYKKKKHCCSRLYNKERKKYYNSLRLKKSNR